MKIGNVMLSNKLGGLEKIGIEYSNLINLSGNYAVNFFRNGIDLVKFKFSGDINILNIRNQYDIFSAYKIAKICKKNEIKILILHGSRAVKIALLTRIFYSKIKLISIQHSEFTFKNLNKMDKVIALNEKSKAKIIQSGVKKEKAFILPNFIDLSKYSPQKKDLKNIKNIGWIGRFDKIKGPDIFIEVANSFRNENVNFLIGGGNKDNLYCKDLLLKNSNIKFLGWVENVQDFFSQIDILCITSRSETFCVLMVEAMACGIPIIATPCDGIKEISSNVVNSAIIINSFNSVDIKNAILDCINNKHSFNEISKNAIKNANSYDISNRKIIDTFKEILL